MKRRATSKPLFSPDEVAAAVEAAPEAAVEDADNPATRPGDWDHAIVSRSLPELREEDLGSGLTFQHLLGYGRQFSPPPRQHAAGELRDVWVAVRTQQP